MLRINLKIMYMFRKGPKTILSFKSNDEVTCGARPDHLRNKEIVIADSTDGDLKISWDEVYVK